MKKNIILASSLVLGTLSLATFSTQSYAEVVNEATTNASLTAKESDSGSDPVDPDNPDDPNQSTDPDKDNGVKPGNQTGPLQIDYLSNLNFGTDIAITGQTVQANVQDLKTRFCQVSDLRGTGAGWKLNASLGDFKNKDKTITGAKITFTNGEARTSNADKTDKAATVKSEIVLNAGGAVDTMLSATEGNGRGVWLAAYPVPAGAATGNSNIVFEAPTNNIDADTAYTAVINWQLLDGPSA